MRELIEQSYNNIKYYVQLLMILSLLSTLTFKSIAMQGKMEAQPPEEFHSVLNNKKSLIIACIIVTLFCAEIKPDKENQETGSYCNRFGLYEFIWNPNFMSNLIYFNFKVNIYQSIIGTLSSFAACHLFLNLVKRCDTKNQEEKDNFEENVIQKFHSPKRYLMYAFLFLFDIGINIKYSEKNYIEVDILSLFFPLIITINMEKHIKDFYQQNPT